MTDSLLGGPLVVETEVVVIGAGLSGIAAAIHLARCNFRVMCIEQRSTIEHIVGESLDWSAPDLLAGLGLPMDKLIAMEAATWKRQVKVARADGEVREYLPGPWLTQPPWRVETRTLHLDRGRTDSHLRQAAQALGVTLLNERVTDFAVLDEDAPDRRILGLRTAQGTFVRANWFIDASGADASLLGRRFHLPSVAYGPRKVAIWSHVATREWAEGTTLYMAPRRPGYMDWIWEIPVRPGISSIGYVAPGRVIKEMRARGMEPLEILRTRCHSFSRLRELMQSAGDAHAAATTFLCRTYRQVCGTNWVIIGEAASQSDPITGNGVTAALRHAEEASDLITRNRRTGTIPKIARVNYSLRVEAAGRYFNSLIERLFYKPVLRNQFGIFSTARIYTVPAWLMNLIYSRIQPRGAFKTLALVSLMAVLRGVCWAAYQLGLCRETFKQASSITMLPAREQAHAL